MLCTPTGINELMNTNRNELMNLLHNKGNDERDGKGHQTANVAHTTTEPVLGGLGWPGSSCASVLVIVCIRELAWVVGDFRTTLEAPNNPWEPIRDVIVVGHYPVQHVGVASTDVQVSGDFSI
jgi:hypothetical protein